MLKSNKAEKLVPLKHCIKIIILDLFESLNEAIFSVQCIICERVKHNKKLQCFCMRQLE